MNQQNTTNDLRRQAVVEKMWLHHYNNTLLEKGLITQTQHRRMMAKINSCRKSDTQRYAE